ncbi:MAG: CoB--CoM heterodisulfide reductase iron-sulfur subunit B family protein [Methanomassiliicoccales archaeon]|nr:MAG: CoB--CoM heterodisulfide reductase iron-sulfur subunit B family protein [Methanomassiliicoccales archaeon]
MKVTYYPGCTLYTKAKNLGDLAVASSKELGIELVELEDWTCCQAAFPLVDDNIMGMISSARIIINAEKLGSKLTTLCSFCYNVLKRTNEVLKNDPEKKAKICEFLEEEYRGEIEVVHFLEILRDDVGFDKLKKAVKRKLKGLAVVPYYGCQIIRPASILKFDDPENPMTLDDFLESLGCDVVDFPFKVECCGSFQIIHPEVKDTALGCSYNILKSAHLNGAEAVALSCPVCYFNLDKKQNEIADSFGDFERIPIMYFTELLGLALDVDYQLFDFSKHAIDPRPLLTEKGLIEDKRITVKEEAK